MYHFEIFEIEVFVDITLSTFNSANMSRGLSNPICGAHPQVVYSAMGYSRAIEIGHRMLNSNMRECDWLNREARWDWLRKTEHNLTRGYKKMRM